MPSRSHFVQVPDPESSNLSPDLLCAADCPSEPVEWLWPNRIPYGKVTLLVGDPGLGKSLVALDIAARVTRNAPWPDHQSSPDGPSGHHRQPGSVIILSAEDDLSDTIRPRLDAAGADLSRIFFIPSIVDLRIDFAKLRAALERAPDCRLIVIDPVNAYVGPGDSHFHTIVRRVLQPLAKLAAERGIAILGISHLRKSVGTAIQRTAGSMGFVATARAVWTVCRDPVDTTRHLLLPLKNNFVSNATGLAYTIAVPPSPPLSDESFGIDCHHAPAITWQPDVITTSAADALGPQKADPEAEEITLACSWLRSELADGPKPALDLITDGMLFGGFSERSLRRALVAIGGQTNKQGFKGGWTWNLPGAQAPQADEPGPPLAMSASEKPCPLREKTQELKQKPCPLRENKPDRQQNASNFREVLEAMCAKVAGSADRQQFPKEKSRRRRGKRRKHKGRGHPLAAPKSRESSSLGQSRPLRPGKGPREGPGEGGSGGLHLPDCQSR